MVHVGVRCGVTQGAAHRDDLAFVMKSVGQDVMQDECGRADGDVSVGETELLIRVELLIGEGGKIRLGLLTDLLLQKPGVRKRGTFGRIPINIGKSLQDVNPESFAVEDVDHLVPQRGEAEVGQFSQVVARWNRRQVVERYIEAGVCPGMKFLDAFEGERCGRHGRVHFTAPTAENDFDLAAGKLAIPQPAGLRYLHASM